MTKLRAYEGGCHCERVRFRVTADLSTVTICNCSICTKKGSLIVPQEQFELLCGSDDLHVQHWRCQAYILQALPRSDPDKIDVNVRCIDQVDLAALKPKYFDGKHWEDAHKFWQQS
jgi:hypothetical protein